MYDSRSLTTLRLETQCHNRQGCGLDTALTRAEVAPASSGKLPDQPKTYPKTRLGPNSTPFFSARQQIPPRKLIFLW